MAEKADFIRLFMPLQGDLLGYVFSMGVPAEDADDLLQNAALQIYEKIGEFKAGTNFRAWAFGFVRNEVHRHYKGSRRRMLSLSEKALADIDLLAGDEQAASNVQVQTLSRCLEKLQGTARDLLALRYREGLDVKSIADRLRRPAESVYVTLSRIRKTLQECVSRTASLAEESR